MLPHSLHQCAALLLAACKRSAPCRRAPARALISLHNACQPRKPRRVCRCTSYAPALKRASNCRAQVEALDRVLTRLALTEDGALEVVLAKLLPRVIEQLKTPHQRVKQVRPADNLGCTRG